MISYAVRNLARAGAARRTTLSCLPAILGRSPHVIPTDTGLLDSKPLGCSTSRCISFNPLAKPLKKARLNYTGALLYEGIADHLNYQYFFDGFKMDDTFMSWFLVTELHVYMLMLRVMQEGEDGQMVRNFIVETMWEDVQARSKKLGVPNTTKIKKQVTQLSEEFNASMIGYDESILQSDSILAGHLWRRFFSAEKVDPVLLEKLVHYIRRQLYMLSHFSRSQIINMSPQINWVYV